MRVGSNPFKSAKAINKPNLITVALLVHIPFETGYFRECVDVLKLSLQSIYRNTTLPHDILVFDSASDESVVDFLINEQRDGRIQYLVLSEANVPKTAALNIILGASPGEYIAYSDSDVFFHPGWLESHMEILETYPKVGLVNGLPAPHLTHWATSSTLSIAEQTPEMKIEKGRLMSPEIIASLCEGVGRSLEDYSQEIESLEDIRLTYRGVQAYVGAHHFQFVARKSVRQAVGPLPVTATFHYTDERQFDEILDAAGYMRLSTPSACVFHLGNVLTAKWREVANEYGLALKADSQSSDSVTVGNRFKQTVRDNPVVKRALLKLYGTIFNLYYDDRKRQS